jgi:hypothetical protein
VHDGRGAVILDHAVGHSQAVCLRARVN